MLVIVDSSVVDGIGNCEELFFNLYYCQSRVNKRKINDAPCLDKIPPSTETVQEIYRKIQNKLGAA